MDTILSESAGFNPTGPYFMHIDLNSCFASVEQQANPGLRGKPVAVAAYTTGGGCILAASREAKKLGIKTGLRVRDGRAICPELIVLPPDPNKYRYVNRQLLALLRHYSAGVEVKSIDEMILNLNKSARLYSGDQKVQSSLRIDSGQAKLKIQSCSLEFRMRELATEIKSRIKDEVGDWLTVSVGIAPNRFLAKTASELHKPDGLDVITGENIESVLQGLKPEDLCGIKSGYGGRLREFGITTAIGFYRAGIRQLKAAFRSVVGYHWWLRLHGYEADDRQFARKSFGHSYALYKPYRTTEKALLQILCQLSGKMGRRLRHGGYMAGGIHVACLFPDWTFWHHGCKLPEPVFAGSDLYKTALKVLSGAPDRPVRIIAVSCFDLVSGSTEQLMLYGDDDRKKSLSQALDLIADRWGEGAVAPGLSLGMERKILDRISFGGVKDLEEMAFSDCLEYEAVEDPAACQNNG